MAGKTIDVAALIGKVDRTNGYAEMRASGLFDCSNADHEINTLSGLIHHARGRQSAKCNALALLDRLVNVDKVVTGPELAAVVADMNRPAGSPATVNWNDLWPKIAARVAKIAG